MDGRTHSHTHDGWTTLKRNASTAYFIYLCIYLFKIDIVHEAHEKNENNLINNLKTQRTHTQKYITR